MPGDRKRSEPQEPRISEDPHDRIEIKGFAGEFTQKDDERIAENRLRHTEESLMSQVLLADQTFWAVAETLPIDFRRRLHGVLGPYRKMNVPDYVQTYRDHLEDVASDYEGPGETEIRESASRLAFALSNLLNFRKGDEPATTKRKIGFN